MIADHIIEKGFQEKDKNGNTLFISRTLSRKKVALTPKEEEELKKFLRKVCNFFSYLALFSIPFLKLYVLTYIIPFTIIYKIGVKKILKDKA